MTDGQFGLFGADPWWLVIGKAVAIFGLLVLLTLFTIWWERQGRLPHAKPDRTQPRGATRAVAVLDGRL